MKPRPKTSHTDGEFESETLTLIPEGGFMVPPMEIRGFNPVSIPGWLDAMHPDRRTNPDDHPNQTVVEKGVLNTKIKR